MAVLPHFPVISIFETALLTDLKYIAVIKCTQIFSVQILSEIIMASKLDSFMKESLIFPIIKSPIITFSFLLSPIHNRILSAPSPTLCLLGIPANCDVNPIIAFNC